MKVGVLALQGAFALHQDRLEACGVDARPVRAVADLVDCDRLVIPGGESSTMSLLLQRSGLFDAIAGRIDDGMPAFGTCAGAILLASDVLDGRDDQRWFGAIDVAVRRNAYGRQVDSFEGDLGLVGEADPFRAAFIRAPAIESVGDDVEVLAAHAGRPVMCRQRTILICTFHPEVTDDTRIHRMFLELGN
jgi:5'-phosphate synthase pdxT subunit